MTQVATAELIPKTLRRAEMCRVAITTRGPQQTIHELVAPAGRVFGKDLTKDNPRRLLHEQRRGVGRYVVSDTLVDFFDQVEDSTISGLLTPVSIGGPYALREVHVLNLVQHCDDLLRVGVSEPEAQSRVYIIPFVVGDETFIAAVHYESNAMPGIEVQLYKHQDYGRAHSLWREGVRRPRYRVVLPVVP